MKDCDLAKMPLDDLWRLHEQIIQLLDRKLQQEARKLQRRLDELGRKFGGAPSDIPPRRPYPKVEPKFRNPNDPSETWSGRGKQLRWVTELLVAGETWTNLGSKPRTGVSFIAWQAGHRAYRGLIITLSALFMVAVLALRRRILAHRKAACLLT